MPSTDALLKAYGHILVPNHEEMTYKEAFEEGYYKYDIRQDLMRLYERDCQTIKEIREEE